jgi:hypothetical protein
MLGGLLVTTANSDPIRNEGFLLGFSRRWLYTFILGGPFVSIRLFVGSLLSFSQPPAHSLLRRQLLFQSVTGAAVTIPSGDLAGNCR